MNKHPIAACVFFTCTALAGYAAQFGDYTYVEHTTTIEITDYPEDATGDLVILSEIVGKPVTSIGEEAFLNCSSLTSVTIPNSVTSIGREAFFACSNLTSVTIPNSVTSIGFDAFSDCTSLTSVTIPDSVTSIDVVAFWNCNSLTAITVDTANSAYSSVDGVIFDKNQTTILQWPGGRAGAYTIPDSVTSIGDWAFSACISLTSVKIPDGVTSIGDSAFERSTSLTSVTIPDSVTSIGVAAFFECTALTSVTIPDGITSIGEKAFMRCSSLTSVTIPDSVASIERAAFFECTALTSVYFKGDAPSHGDVIFEGAPATVYYLAGTNGWGGIYGDRPAFEARLGGIPVDGLEGWFVSEWFGYYATTLSPWLFHADHGWLYQNPGSSNDSTFIYDGAMGAWWYTSETGYPFIYAFDPPADNAGTDIESEWLWYSEETKTPRSFGVVTGPYAGSVLFFGP